MCTLVLFSSATEPWALTPPPVTGTPSSTVSSRGGHRVPQPTTCSVGWTKYTVGINKA